MSLLIPEEELHAKKSLNLAPMVDFLFLLLALFAVLAMTRTTLFDSEVEVVQVETPFATQAEQDTIAGSTILLSVSAEGSYKWVTEFNEFLLEDIHALKQELHRQEELGFLPKERANTRVLLQIDKSAPWDPVAKLIFTMKEDGYSIHPIYTPLPSS